MIIKRSDIVEQYLLLLLKIIYLKQEKEREREKEQVFIKYMKKRVEMSNKIIIFILFVFDEFDDKQIQIHSNMHFHY